MKNLFYFLALMTGFSACGTAPDQKITNEKPPVVVFTDLENPDSLVMAEPIAWKNEQTVVEGMAHSGKLSSHIDPTNEFSIVFQQKLGYISEQMPEGLNFEAWVYSPAAAPSGLMVVSIDDAPKPYYQSYAIADFFAKGNEWKQLSATFELPDSLLPSNSIKVYIWNNKKSELWIDDISLSFTFPAKGR